MTLLNIISPTLGIEGKKNGPTAWTQNACVPRAPFIPVCQLEAGTQRRPATWLLRIMPSKPHHSSNLHQKANLNSPHPNLKQLGKFFGNKQWQMVTRQHYCDAGGRLWVTFLPLPLTVHSITDAYKDLGFQLSSCIFWRRVFEAKREIKTKSPI